VQRRNLVVIGFILLSGLLHVGSGIGLVRLADPSARRRAIAIAVIEKPKPKPKTETEEKPKEPEPPKPKPPAPKPPKPEPKAPPIAVAPPRPVARRAAPVQTSIAMSNSDSGGGSAAVAGSGGAGAAGGGDSGPQRPAAAEPPRKPQKPKPEAPAEETCSEEPSKPVSLTQPSLIEYPQQARADGIEGKLVLLVKVGADGLVSDVEVLKSVDPSLDAAAVAAVKTWTFKPALRCGKPVASSYKIARTFELGD
jgi:protein TonB